MKRIELELLRIVFEKPSMDWGAWSHIKYYLSFIQFQSIRISKIFKILVY
ncbi:uncharacterized protein METZ01_LOCUS452199 [marine metagenome]|uniref:Uncharacterized protein n=1 Tax=marine metagenome TaxID=408172 RepID=A0A382ZWH9_9ZZZZ